MLKPPFVVESYFFPHIDVSADPNFNPKTDLVPPSYDVNTSVTRDKNTDLYQVALEIKLEPENEDKRQPYSLNLIGIGIFRFIQSVSDPEKLLRINGASILYSSAREFLITVTARGPWGPVMLPTWSFLEEAEVACPPEKAKPKKGKVTFVK